MADLIIRDLDAEVVAKIDSLAKAGGYRSREAFLRSYLRNLSVLSELKELDDKYSVLVKKTLEVIRNNTEVLYQVMELFDMESKGETKRGDREWQK